MSFRVHFGKNGNFAFVQRPDVELMDVTQVVAHVHSYFLPRKKAEVPLLQKGLVLRIYHSLDDTHDFFLEINQHVDVMINIILEINDLADGISHAGG